jgi:hypothetical protein
MSSKGALNTGVAARTPPANLRATRSNTKVTTQQTNVTSQIATLEKKKAKAKEMETEARKSLVNEKYLSDEDTITQHTLTHALSLITQKYSTPTTPQGLTLALSAIVILMQRINSSTTQLTPVVDELAQKLGERIEKTMMDEMDKMSTMIKSSLADQTKSLSPPESLDEAVTALKQVVSEMSKTMNEATTVTTQINNTALNYKEALLHTTTTQTAIHKHDRSRTEPLAADAELMLGLDKKTRQILLDTTKEGDDSMNIYEIREKAEAALTSTVPPPPQNSEVQEVIKLRNGSIILQFTTKETAEWLRIPANKVAFTRRFDPDTTIRDRVHPIMVPRIPLTLDPSNPTHLREIEEVNRLAPNNDQKSQMD